MKITEEIYKQIIDTAADCVFWKDQNRRFTGVNQAFLDFYGFENEAVVLGKTDEDMGWHSDPEPFMQDELDVLSGKSTHKVQGKCIVRGEERDIIASKHPLYENGSIVGLAGSFLDITDVLRKQNNGNILYTVEELRRYPYFDELLDSTALHEIADPLTGTITRGYMLDFARSLIRRNIPFSFVIMDLDNFKGINDGYGHAAGDRILQDVTKGIAEFMKGKGVIGRFGGDELLLINTGDISYAEKKAFLSTLYSCGTILRKEIPFSESMIFATATAGCASFPADADNYDSLFLLADKMLYHGKEKGRNCYVIYVEEKHRNLTVGRGSSRGMYTAMYGISHYFEKGKDILESLHLVMPILSEELHITDLLYIDGSVCVHSVKDGLLCRNAGTIRIPEGNSYFSDNNMENLRNYAPGLHTILLERKYESVLLLPAGHGWILCGASGNKRIWQDNEKALLFFLSTLITKWE